MADHKAADAGGDGHAMKRLAFALLLAGYASAALAQQTPAGPSLLFLPAEVDGLERLLTDRAAVAAATDSAPVEEVRRTPPDVHIGALLYLGANDWVVWLNGVRRTPRDRQGDLEIARVTPENAEIVWRGDPKSGPLRIRLRPHQTFVGTTGEILEGTILPSR